MANYNHVILVGNLTRDPQLRYTPSQVAVCDFGMAVNRNWTDKSGQKREEVCFVDCTAWARGAEILAKYMSKGRQLLVDGRLTYRSWDGQDGKKHSKLTVTVENFQFLGDRGGGGGGNRDASRPASADRPGAAEESAPPVSDYDFSQDVEDDTIPF